VGRVVVVGNLLPPSPQLPVQMLIAVSVTLLAVLTLQQHPHHRLSAALRVLPPLEM